MKTAVTVLSFDKDSCQKFTSLMTFSKHLFEALENIALYYRVCKYLNALFHPP